MKNNGPQSRVLLSVNLPFQDYASCYNLLDSVDEKGSIALDKFCVGNITG